LADPEASLRVENQDHRAVPRPLLEQPMLPPRLRPTTVLPRGMR
jgi:hypothetical protein